MKILISGSHGLIGSRLVPMLQQSGHRVLRLVRSGPGQDQISWNPDLQQIEVAALDGLDVLIHLAGENLASGRWTAARKARIRNSRIEGTRLLSTALGRVAHPPSVLLCASAVGYYGDRGEEILTEQSAPGMGFLAEVCREWEDATVAAERTGVRVVHLRFGIVLSKSGGALKKMLLPFRLGAGGPMGSGDQFWSWISLSDVLSVIDFALRSEQLNGAVNVVSPQPVTNAIFAKTLAGVLHRPALLRVPALALRLALGEMADAALLASARVVPRKLESAGFTFRDPELKPALEAELSPMGR